MKKTVCVFLCAALIAAASGCGSSKAAGAADAAYSASAPVTITVPTPPPEMQNAVKIPQATAQPDVTTVPTTPAVTVPEQPEQPEQQETAASPTDGIDIDLTQMSSTAVYAEVYGMMVMPDDYVGKTVKASGEFGAYQDPNTGNYYFGIIVYDALACCSQWIEFVLAGNSSYPEDYPARGASATVVGEFQTYMEGQSEYCHLVNARFV